MDKIAGVLTSFPSSPTLSDSELAKEANNHLINVLHKLSLKELCQTSNGTSLLDVLDPSVNSLGFLFALCARLDPNHRDSVYKVWPYLSAFLERYDARQIQYSQPQFRRLVDIMVQTVSPLMAVKVLKKAILRNNPSRFSFMHHLFAHLCLQARCFRDALPILDIDVFDFPVTKNRDVDSGKGFEVTYQEVLQYFVYAAMLYMGMKNWRRATDYLTYVVGAPGNSCSSIQVDAYKKYILVGLLLDGKFPAVPKHASGHASRAYKALAKPYEAFANAFKSGDSNLFRQEVAITQEVMQQDGNTGLAVQCMDAFRRMQIIALRDTYVTLGVDEIAQKDFEVSDRGGDVGSKEETERLILGMIEREEIRATLSQSGTDPATSKTTVHFNTTAIPEEQTLYALEDQIERIVSLNAQVKVMDRKFGLTKEYVQYTNRQSKSGSNTVSLMNMTEPDMMDYDYAGGAGGTWADDEPEEQELVMQDMDDM